MHIVFIRIFASMNRRRFCKIGALAIGALGMGINEMRTKGVSRLSERVPIRSFRLTVIRRECYEDIQSLYLDDPEAGRCEAFAAGEVREFDRGRVCPDSFCTRAWDVIVESVNSAQGCVECRDGVLVVACPDGARPVIFKVELL